MLTRCPACETTFRITPEQLKARQGRVRCGHCQHVFNALDTLIEELAPASQPTQPMVVATATSGESAGSLSVDFELETGGSAPIPTKPASLPAETPPAASLANDVAEISEAGREADPTGFATEMDEGDSEPAAESGMDAEPLLHEDMEPHRRVWPWVLASLFALLTLALQTALLYRVELAVLYPESRPLLLEACSVIGCEVALPSKPELMSIESSDLHPDTSQPGRLQLVATLKNRAPFTQTYPHLELTLTDTADQALARKVLAPADYLAKDVNINAGFGASKDLAVTLNLDAGSLPAAGYRLYLFYP
ncbi:MAG: DUF3426 domain-containing protein [Deltaproteobacteria bacterium]|nr:DUF3426 domain-containing protein [Deltaproteobacteria bacterium]